MEQLEVDHFVALVRLFCEALATKPDADQLMYAIMQGEDSGWHDVRRPGFGADQHDDNVVEDVVRRGTEVGWDADYIRNEASRELLRAARRALYSAMESTNETFRWDQVCLTLPLVAEVGFQNPGSNAFFRRDFTGINYPGRGLAPCRQRP